MNRKILTDLLNLNTRDIRDTLLDLAENPQELNVYLGDLYDELDFLLCDDNLNPKEKLAVFEIGRAIIPQVKVILKEIKADLGLKLRIRVKMINEEVFCTNLKELKALALKFISNDDIKLIIYKTELIDGIEKWMITQGAELEWSKIKSALYNAFVPAARVMGRRYPMLSKTEKLDRGGHNFEASDLKKLDADLLLPILVEFTATAIDDNTMEVNFGKFISVRAMHHEFTPSTSREKTKVVKYDSTARSMLDSIDYISELKCIDYIKKNPGDVKMKILIKQPPEF